jgi:hypothetical protein
MLGHEAAYVERARLGFAVRAELEELGLPVSLLRGACEARHCSATPSEVETALNTCHGGLASRIQCVLSVSELLKVLFRLYAHRRRIAGCGDGTSDCARRNRCCSFLKSSPFCFQPHTVAHA